MNEPNEPKPESSEDSSWSQCTDHPAAEELLLLIPGLLKQITETVSKRQGKYGPFMVAAVNDDKKHAPLVAVFAKGDPARILRRFLDMATNEGVG